mgnify:CR=1 FL=1
MNKNFRFPVITDDLQKAYEVNAEKNNVNSADNVPYICGYHGRACRQMNKEEGANRALCAGCKLAEYKV